jgi:phosphoribosylformylglycinamidine synthase
MALAGDAGAELTKISNQSDSAYWFGEDQETYVVTIDDVIDQRLIDAARRAGLAYQIIGHVGGDALQIEGAGSIPLADLRAAHEGFFPRLMGADAALA